MKIEAQDPKEFNKFIEVEPIINMEEEIIDEKNAIFLSGTLLGMFIGALLGILLTLVF
jgi:hypothetical protein